tara:strand:+ start:993 stop:1571 length:579 start_codon:yes stop_codon:yes gene_type:complete
MTEEKESGAEDKDELLDKGIKIFMGDVNMKTMEPIIEWILAANLSWKKNQKELTLAICSPGGDLNACFALIDVMQGSRIPIRTVGMGMIASCGLLMFISGTKGKRILTPNTSILSHQYSWGSYGKEHELFATVREYELTTERMVNHYKKCTGLEDKMIREKLLPPSDVWLDAKEARKLGICDHIQEMKGLYE